MDFALTTRWNAARHTDGEAMIEEILALGFDGVELGYDLRTHLVPGVRRLAVRKDVRIVSVHNFCPLPLTGGPASPELFTPVDPDPAIRKLAEKHISTSVRFAAETGAGVVVLHAGRVPMRRFTDRLVSQQRQGRAMSVSYDRLLERMRTVRTRRAGRVLSRLYGFIERMLPLLEECRVCLGIENLPTWESVPAPEEMRTLLDRFPSPWLGYWHDLGHGQVRQELGFGSHHRDLALLRDRLTGMHLHDVVPPVRDHLVPGQGAIEFTSFRSYGRMDVCRVFEPHGASPEQVRSGLENLRACWGEHDARNNKEPLT